MVEGLRARLVTGAVLGCTLVVGVWWLPPAGLALAGAAAVMAAAWEWGLLVAGRRAAIAFCLAVGALLGAAGVELELWGAAPDGERILRLLSVACAFWALAVLWVQSYPASGLLWRGGALRFALGVLVLLPPWVAALWLASLPGGRGLLLLALGLVVCVDVGGYFVGHRWGRRPLAPRVSPGKTWEGLAGGVGLALLALAAALAAVPAWRAAWGRWLAVALATAFAAVVGDLFESMVKRQRGVKDSGRLLPGHGGVLDRVDGMTAALPTFAFFYANLVLSAP